MIRVNLLRNRAQAGQSSSGASSSMDFSSEGSSDQKAALKNLFVLFLGVAILLVYEKYNTFTLNDSNMLLTTEYNQIQDELNKAKEDLDKYKISENEAKILEDKLTIIRNLSKVRLREVKALDYIQEIIPDKVWLKQIAFDQKTVRISGYSILDEDLSLFIQALERGAFFESVILSQASETAGKSGSYKQFDIAAKLETVQ